jgi:hypothetical protein
MFLTYAFIFLLAMMLGVELIRKVPAQLHTPLMSGSNAISGISLIGAMVVVAEAGGSRVRAGPRGARRRLRRDQRGGRLRGHRPHARDVQGNKS